MKQYSKKEVVEVLRREVVKAGGQSKFGYENNFAPSFISDVLTGKKQLSDRLAGALGYARSKDFYKVSK